MLGRINRKAMLRVSLALKIRLTLQYLVPLRTVRIDVIQAPSLLIVVTHLTATLGAIGTNLLQRDTPPNTTQCESPPQWQSQLVLHQSAKCHN